MGQICTQGHLRDLAVALSPVSSPRRHGCRLGVGSRGGVGCREDISLAALAARCEVAGLGVGPGRQGI